MEVAVQRFGFVGAWVREGAHLADHWENCGQLGGGWVLWVAGG